MYVQFMCRESHKHSHMYTQVHHQSLGTGWERERERESQGVKWKKSPQLNNDSNWYDGPQGDHVVQIKPEGYRFI